MQIISFCSYKLYNYIEENESITIDIYDNLPVHQKEFLNLTQQIPTEQVQESRKASTLTQGCLKKWTKYLHTDFESKTS